MKEANLRKSILITAVVSLGGFLFGFDASVISGVIRYIRPEFQLNDIQLGWVVSSPSFAAMFSMLIAGKISDLYSRKYVLLTVAFLYTVSAILSAVATGYTMLFIARMIGGFAFGAALVLAPVYIAEISPANSRGKLVSIQQLNIVIGFSAAYFSNYFILQNIDLGGFLTTENGWRVMLAIEAIPSTLYFVGLFLIPFSPRWLFGKGRDDEAVGVLVYLHGDEKGQAEVSEIKESIRKEGVENKGGFKDLLARNMMFVLMIGLAIGVMQQITGVNAIYFYATTIFEQSGIGVDASFSQAVWVGIINVVFTIFAMILIDKMGRKPLMILGLAGIIISMGITSYGFSKATYQLSTSDAVEIENLNVGEVSGLLNQEFDNDVDFKNALKQALGEQAYSNLEGELVQKAITMNATLILVGILGFVASFAISLGPVMWVMLSEMFPNRVRGLAISVIGFVNSLTSWLVQFIFPWELSNLGNSLTYLIYGIFAVLGLLIVIKFLPETKGKSLEELEKELVFKNA